MWTEAQKQGFSLREIALWMAERPARLAGCEARKGRIAAGYDADLVVFDERAEYTATQDELHQRHTVSPYLGEKLRGRVKRTYLRGRVVFCDGEFPGDAIGREFVRN